MARVNCLVIIIIIIIIIILAALMNGAGRAALMNVRDLGFADRR